MLGTEWAQMRYDLLELPNSSNIVFLFMGHAFRRCILVVGGHFLKSVSQRIAQMEG